jgi:F-type H+-transporting ATPase subunit b
MNFDFNLFIQVAQAAEEAASAEKQAGIIGTLGLNWKLFLAQLVNFSIILYILRKYVFVPISQKLSERSEKIEKALKDAQDIEVQKTEFDKWKNEEISKTRVEISEMMEKAEKESQAFKQAKVLETKQAQEKIIQQANLTISSNQAKAMTEVKEHAADLVTTATEKILKQKLDGKKDAELVKESLKDIK